MRRLLAILIWSVVYFYAVGVKIHSTWSMSIYKIKHWVRLVNDWRTGRWVVDTPNEYTLCLVLVLLIPIWLVGIFVICRLIRPKIPSASVVQKATASHPFIPAYTPANMPSQGKAAVLSEPTPSPTTPETNTADDQATQTDWVPKDTGEAAALDEITRIAEENGLTPFPHVLLENELIPITISSDEDALLIKVLAVSGNWQVGMTEPLDQSIWSCNGQSKNVLKEIVLGKGILAKMEPESKVISVVVLAQGSLENMDVVLPWLNQHEIEIVTLPQNQQPGLPQLSDILKKYFNLTETQEVEGDEEQHSSVTQ